MSFKLTMLTYKTFDEVVLVLDGDDNCRELMEEFGNNLENWPDDYGLYQTDAGLRIVEAEYDDQELDNLIESKSVAPTPTLMQKLATGADPLMNI